MFEISIIPYKDVSPDTRAEIQELADAIFGHISKDEIEEDFNVPKFAIVTAQNDGVLVGYTGLYKREIDHRGRKVCLGGFGGLMVRETMRGQGIGTALCKKALEVLAHEGVGVAFHSIESDGAMEEFYKELGFKLLSRPFSWKNKKGEIKSDMGGMLAPVNSPDLYEMLIQDSEPLYVGEGYW